MNQISELSQMLANMPLPALIVAVILAAFALSAYTVSAVVKLAKGRRNDR